MAKRVSVPLVIAKQKDGSFVHLYEGALLPDTLDKDEAERLADYFEDDDEKAKPSSKSSK